MTKYFFPFSEGAGSSVYEAQWSKMMRTVVKDGIVNSYLNELEVYGDSTGMRVKVKTGAGWVKGHYYENDAEETVTISAADATNARWDLVALEVDWTKSDNQMSIVVVQGTPAASPSLPSLTQNSSKWQVAFAKVVVGAGVTTITAANVTDLRPKLVGFKVINGTIYKQLWIAGWNPTKTNGCAERDKLETSTNKIVIDHCAFDKDAVEYAYVNAPMPDDYSGGAVYYTPYWTQQTGATSYGVSWGLQAVSFSDDDALDTAPGTAVNVLDVGGTTNDLYKNSFSSALIIAGTPTAGDLVCWKMCRNATDVTNDNLNVDAYLIGTMVWYPVQ